MTRKTLWTVLAAVLITAAVTTIAVHEVQAYDIGRTTQAVYYRPATLAGATNMTLANGVTISLTGTAKITRIKPTVPGRFVIFCTTSTDTLVDGVNLKLAGNFNGTADDVIGLVYSITGAAADTFYTESFRSVN